MGGGTYSLHARATRSATNNWDTKSAAEIFTNRTVNKQMDPINILLRESRDSDEHPNSLATIVALDVTGSMGMVPHNLVQNGLPKLMEKIIQAGERDNQVLFMAVGDHQCDRSPLQVGQFECSDELLDKWLTEVYLEGGGGANEGESYLLAWWFAALNTSVDCFEKRSRKGFLFTIGDEPTLGSISGNSLDKITGKGQNKNWSASDLLAEASKMYNVFHIHIGETYAGRQQYVVDGWKKLMGDNLLIAQHHDQVPDLISDTIINLSKREEVVPHFKTTSEAPSEMVL